MKFIVFTSQFKRDYKKRQREKGINELLDDTLDKISSGTVLSIKFRDHPLKGNYFGCRECHLKPDLLLIYTVTDTELHLIRLGSHSDLFS
ncbi:MAG: hypothetical protein A3F67_01540 [Verrucomicrobia bacterium RIFCSPHIGHO2_12_FULL_41_10]|nr:MAG: hypothetical protein A3F67_01540 [Verrucomicrobia bacterium RIFCSPHIGHO2_12_FULL_41_10]HLB33662.1 type II toxin-antitoxin system YafQ family toxin [Chthoniobacterales bacterium]